VHASNRTAALSPVLFSVRDFLKTGCTDFPSEVKSHWEVHEIWKAFHAFQGLPFGIFVKKASTQTFIKVSRFLGSERVTMA
jgi:hypothetical protein